MIIPSYSKIEDDITRLQEIACLELETTKRAEQTKVTLLLTTDICWYSSVDDYFKALRLRIKNNKEKIPWLLHRKSATRKSKLKAFQIHQKHIYNGVRSFQKYQTM
ncbi:hypothetical protein ACLB1S_06555 [Escherichia coli]